MNNEELELVKAYNEVSRDYIKSTIKMFPLALKKRLIGVSPEQQTRGDELMERIHLDGIFMKTHKEEVHAIRDRELAKRTTSRKK